MNPRLREGLRAATGFGLQMLQRQHQIEARTQFETVSTDIAGEIDRFNLDLEQNPNYQTYGQQWEEKRRVLQSRIEAVSNPDARKELELFLDKAGESQSTVLAQKTIRRISQESYVNRINSLNLRLSQGHIPIQNKMADIDATVSGLFQDGIIDHFQSNELKASLATAAVGEDVSSRALALFREVEQTRGSQEAFNAAEEFLLSYQNVFSVGGQTISVSNSQRNAAQSSVRDAFNISLREQQLAAEKLFRSEDERMYRGFSAFVSGDLRQFTHEIIDAAQLPVDRKMYWRNQMEQASSIGSQPSGYPEQHVDELWVKLNMALTEIKREGAALNQTKHVYFGDRRLEFADESGLLEILRENTPLFIKRFGDRWATMYRQFIETVDKPTGVTALYLQKIENELDEKDLSEYEKGRFQLMFRNFVSESGGTVTLEQADEWFKEVVEKPKLKTLVRAIDRPSAGIFPGDDDKITRMIATNDFRYHIIDNRPANPDTKDALNSWAAALEKRYVEVENLTVGQGYFPQWTSSPSGSTFWLNRKRGDITERVTAVPLGNNRRTAMIKFTYRNNVLLRTEVHDGDKWVPARQQRDDPTTWHIVPAASPTSPSPPTVSPPATRAPAPRTPAARTQTPREIEVSDPLSLSNWGLQ